MSSNSREAAAARAAALLAEATLEEKAGLLFHPATYIGRKRDLELVRKRGISHLNIVDGSDPAEIARLTVEHLLNAAYRHQRRVSDRRPSVDSHADHRQQHKSENDFAKEHHEDAES